MRELHPGKPSRARTGGQKQDSSVLLELIAKPRELRGATAGAQHHHCTPQRSCSLSPMQSAQDTRLHSLRPAIARLLGSCTKERLSLGNHPAPSCRTSGPDLCHRYSTTNLPEQMAPHHTTEATAVGGTAHAVEKDLSCSDKQSIARVSFCRDKGRISSFSSNLLK